MIARASQLFLPTLRDDPADADAVSHKLLVRGGFIRQVSAGVWTFLPLGWRVHRKIEQIIREEMDAIGGQEFLAPVLTPVELWEATGRAKIPELFHLTDRTGRRFILPMTHEETFTFHAREIQSNRHAYHRIFERCGLEVYDVQAESGIMGGKFSIDFLAPSGSGENTLVICENGDYAADQEVARAVPRPPEFPSPLAAPEDVATPGVKTCEELADFLGIDLASTSKAMPVVKEDGTVVLALLRGDDRLSETKLFDALPGPSRPATDEEIRAAFGAAGGSLGPIGFEGEVLVDDTLREGQFVAR